MIVRVIGQGQYEVDAGLIARLNELDQQAMQALDREDEAELDGYLDEMGRLVREEGTRLADEVLTPSDIVIPPSDLTLEETRRLVTEQGFLPDPML
jgi:hypothetical protein